MFHLSYIRTIYSSRLEIDEKLMSKLDEYSINNLEDNPDNSSYSDLVSCTASSDNLAIGANILMTLHNNHDQTMITDDTIESSVFSLKESDNCIKDIHHTRNDDNNEDSIKLDELYLVGDIEGGLIRPTLDESAKSEVTAIFNTNILLFMKNTKEEKEQLNVRLVNIFLSNLLSQSFISSFKNEPAKDVISRLNAVVHKTFVDEIMQCYLNGLGDEFKCRLMFMKLKNMERTTREFNTEKISKKLADSFDQNHVSSTLQFFRDNNQMTNFLDNEYAQYNQIKKI